MIHKIADTNSQNSFSKQTTTNQLQQLKETFKMENHHLKQVHKNTKQIR